MKRSHVDEAASTKTDQQQPRIGPPCGTTRNGTSTVFVNFTSNDVFKQHGAVDAIFLDATSCLLAHLDTHAVFSSGPANTRLRACVTWLALRCDLTRQAVIDVLTGFASNVATKCGPALLWDLQSSTPCQLYVALQALGREPLRCSSGSLLSCFITNGNALVFEDNVLDMFDGRDCTATSVAMAGPVIATATIAGEHRATVERFERDKYPTLFLSGYTLHRKAARVAVASEHGLAAAAMPLDDDCITRPSIDVLLPALHKAFQTTKTPEDFRCLLAIFSALTDPVRSAGKVFAFRTWRHGGTDGMEALLLKHLPTDYIKPKVFVMTSASALARPLTAVWWWLLKTIETVDPSSQSPALLASTALLFELASNVMRAAEAVLLWCVFGTLVGLRYGDAPKRWMPTSNVDADTRHVYDVPWLHGLSEVTPATTDFAVASARLSDFARSCTASESAALMASKTITEQLLTRAIVDVSDVMAFETPF